MSPLVARLPDDHVISVTITTRACTTNDRIVTMLLFMVATSFRVKEAYHKIVAMSIMMTINIVFRSNEGVYR